MTAPVLLRVAGESSSIYRSSERSTEPEPTEEGGDWAPETTEEDGDRALEPTGIEARRLVEATDCREA